MWKMPQKWVGPHILYAMRGELDAEAEVRRELNQAESELSRLVPSDFSCWMRLFLLVVAVLVFAGSEEFDAPDAVHLAKGAKILLLDRGLRESDPSARWKNSVIDDRFGKRLKKQAPQWCLLPDLVTVVARSEIGHGIWVLSAWVHFHSLTQCGRLSTRMGCLSSRLDSGRGAYAAVLGPERIRGCSHGGAFCRKGKCARIHESHKKI